MRSINEPRSDNCSGIVASVCSNKNTENMDEECRQWVAIVVADQQTEVLDLMSKWNSG